MHSRVLDVPIFENINHGLVESTEIALNVEHIDLTLCILAVSSCTE